MARKFSSQGLDWWEIKSASGNTIVVNDYDFYEYEIDMLEEIYLGTDRTLIVVSVAYLEDYLRKILRTFLIDDDVVERLLDPMGGALSGFATMADDLTPVWRTQKMSDRLRVRSKRWDTRSTRKNSSAKC